MPTYYFDSKLTWEQHLRANSFVQDQDGIIRKLGKQHRYSISERTKQIVASNEVLDRAFGKDFDQNSSMIAEGFGIIGQPVEVMCQGMKRLGATFEYEMSLLLEQVALQCGEREGLLKQLAPSEQSQNQAINQARELYSLGNDMLSKGLLDKALESFLKAEEQDNSDVFIQYALGHLYLYGSDANTNLPDLIKARRHFLNAVRLAAEVSGELIEFKKICAEASFHASVAYYVQANEELQKGAGRTLAQQLIQQAATQAKQALEIFPESGENFYQYAKLCALLGQPQEAVKSLKIAVRRDRNYCLKAEVDRDFNSIRSDDIPELFETLRQEAESRAQQELYELSELLDQYAFMTAKGRAIQRDVKHLIENSVNWYQNGTYSGYLDVIEGFRRIRDLIESSSTCPDTLFTTLQGHTDDVRSLSFSSCGRFLVSGSSDNTVRIWKVPSGSKIVTLQRHTGRLYSVLFSPDGQYLLSRGSDYTARIWEFPSWREVAVLEGQRAGGFHSATFNPQGTYLALGGSDHAVLLWHAQKESPEKGMRKLLGHKGGIHSVSFNRNGQYLASGSSDTTIRLWELPSGHPLAVFKGHKGRVHSVSFGPNDQYLASGGDDRVIRLWKISSEDPLHLTIRGHKKAVHSVLFSPDGQYLASRGVDDTVRLWEIPSGKELAVLQVQGVSVYSVAFSPDCRYLALGRWDNTVQLWELSSGKEVAVLQGRSIAFSRDGQYLATGSRDGSIRLWGQLILPKQSFSVGDTARWVAEAHKSHKEFYDDDNSSGLCVKCGDKLKFFDKLLGQTLCKNCR